MRLQAILICRKEMVILVTGCAGFIGSHLCERLLDAGHEIHGVDVLTTYYEPALKRRNLSRSLESPRFHFHHSAISEAPPDLFREAEVVYHLAAQPGVRGSWGGQFETYVTNNLLATQFLLEQVCTSKRLKRFVYASSSSVYGNTMVPRVAEDHPTKPHSPYGVTKLAAEHLCSLYGNSYGLPIISLRLFTVCGPRQRPDMMFHKLIRAALTGTTFPIYGDGSMERDFTPVMDVVRAFVLAGETSTSEMVLNIASGKVISLRQAIALIEELCGTRIAMEYRAERRGDVRRTSADISKAATLLAYRPEWSLHDTLRVQVEEVKQRLSESERVAGGTASGPEGM